jgi:16S rRNA C967 or C1407 C5-methylase (RsmB/RsmF family)
MWPPSAQGKEAEEVGVGSAKEIPGAGQGVGKKRGNANKRAKKRKKQKFPLERCLRILPHLQDSGGFFVALLRKVAPLQPQGSWPQDSGAQRQY